jgi:heme exporter protein D
MRYVLAGYVFVLAVLALYAVQLVWRRRRLVRAVAKVSGHAATAPEVGEAP